MLSVDVDSGHRNRNLFLLWYCWSHTPDRQLPFWAMPTAAGAFEDFRLAVNEGVPFSKRCGSMTSGLSLFAKYLVCPETLPLSIYNLVALKVPEAHAKGACTILEEFFLVGQGNSQEYAPYILRWHYRPLPECLLEKILRKFHGFFSMDDAPQVAQHFFFPHIKSGISEPTFRTNFRLFLDVQKKDGD
eukprot:4312059-Amphidinium_carterae.1